MSARPYAHHAQAVRLHGRAHTLLVGADGGADSLPAFAQFRSDRLLVLAECGFQHFAGTLLLRFRFSALSPSPALKDCSGDGSRQVGCFASVRVGNADAAHFVVRTTSKPALSSASVTS